MTTQRTAVDWAHQVRALVGHPRYAHADRITLMCDNLNTHNFASLYKAFEPAQALWIVNKLEILHTPKHGSWLNMAQCELSVLTRQYLCRRMAQVQAIQQAANAWATARNAKQHGIDWQFKNEKARVKLKTLYPST